LRQHEQTEWRGKTSLGGPDFGHVPNFDTFLLATHVGQLTFIWATDSEYSRCMCSVQFRAHRARKKHPLFRHRLPASTGIRRVSGRRASSTSSSHLAATKSRPLGRAKICTQLFVRPGPSRRTETTCTRTTRTAAGLTTMRDARRETQKGGRMLPD
jgi:hypothetical protein